MLVTLPWSAVGMYILLSFDRPLSIDLHALYCWMETLTKAGHICVAKTSVSWAVLICVRRSPYESVKVVAAEVASSLAIVFP